MSHSISSASGVLLDIFGNLISNVLVAVSNRSFSFV